MEYYKASTARSYLEQMLVDETAEPRAVPLSVLEAITGGFSDDQVIGSGGFSVVYKGILGYRAVAVKKFSHAYMHEKQFHREIECLMQVKHKNVVRFLGYCADTQGSMERYNGKLVMADVQQRLLCFEYIPKGSLDKYITDAYREWETCYKIIRGICEGLQCLHENHIIHLDLKPANIMLDNNLVPKIIDFGVSKCFDQIQTQQITQSTPGTVGYLAPERLERGVITPSTDLYSLGVVILEILTGQRGYQAIEDVLESWRDRLERSLRETQFKQIKVCHEIALECRDFNPKKRPASARNIIDRLTEVETRSSPPTPLVLSKKVKDTSSSVAGLVTDGAALPHYGRMSDLARWLADGNDDEHWIRMRETADNMLCLRGQGRFMLGLAEVMSANGVSLQESEPAGGTM